MIGCTNVMYENNLLHMYLVDKNNNVMQKLINMIVNHKTRSTIKNIKPRLKSN